MSHVIKKLVKRTPFYRPLRNLLSRVAQERQLREWEANGRPAPPPAAAKHRSIRALAEQYGLKVFVETGTFYGDTIEAVKSLFDTVYSIELSRDLYEGAKNRFRSDQNVNLIWGDSGTQIGAIMKDIRQPALFWLDAHYSGGDTARGKSDTPIYEELTHILAAPDIGHVILIDDAHCFGTNPDYPDLEDLSEFVLSKRENVTITVDENSIRITPVAQR